MKKWLDDLKYIVIQYNYQKELVAAIVIAVLLSTFTLFESNFNIYEVKQELLQPLDYDGSIPETVFLISYFVKIVAYIIVLECIGKMMIDTYKNKTPFLSQNIKRMKALTIAAFLFWDLMYFVIILAVYELFKYGYKLQQESDETL